MTPNGNTHDGADARPVVLIHPDPKARNGRGARMAATLAGAGYAVTIATGTTAGWPTDVTTDGVTRLPVLPSLPAAPGDTAAATAITSTERTAMAAALAGLNLHAAHAVQVTGAPWMTAVVPHMGPDTRLIYDVPGDAPGATPTEAGDMPGKTFGNRSGHAFGSFQRSDRGGGATDGGAAHRWLSRTRRWIQRQTSGLRLTIEQRQSISRADAVLCIGYLFGEFLQREFKLERVPVVPIYPGVAYTDPVVPTTVWPVPDGRPALAVLDPDYAALEQVIRAAARVREVDLVVVNGHGDWAVCERWAEQYRLGGRIHHVAPLADAVLPCLAAAQVGLVLPTDSHQEALYDLPDAMFQFLMAGVPVVTSWLPGIERLVSRHNFGLVADPGDGLMIADQAARICLDTVLRDRLLHNVGIVREQRYSWEVQGQRLLTLYRQLLPPGL